MMLYIYYSSAAELQDDIQRWFHEIPLAAKSQSSLYVFKKLLRRHRYGAVIAALLTIILLGFSCTYYYLYSQLKAKTAKLERTWTKLYDEREATGQLRNQLAFDLILDRWHKGLRDRVRSEGQQFLDEGGREVQAVEFLLDDRPLSEKVNAFRRQLGDSEPFFTAFVLAEHYLHDGDRQKALTLYRQSLRQQAGSTDGILRYRVQKKIVELMEAEDSMDP